MSVVCPSCRKKLHPPQRLAGRRVNCPRCEEPFRLPDEIPQSAEEIPTPPPEPTIEEEEPLPASARLGMIALLLGALSILVLCLPFVGGYSSLVLSGIGLLLSLGGLLRSWMDGDEAMNQSFAGGIGVWGKFGARARDYPLAALGACVFALALALLPTLWR